MNAIGALLPQVAMCLVWSQGGTLLSKVLLKVTSFLFISNQPFNKDEQATVALFDLPQSLDRVPSDEGEQQKGVGILSYPQHSQFFNTFLRMP
jgi:hypothetical protein